MSDPTSPPHSPQGLALVRDSIRAIPDFPKPGILFRDITPLLGDGAALAAAMALHVDAAAQFEGPVDCICGIESRGFLFGLALANHLGVGFAPIRKPGKLPATTVSESYALEYGTDTLELHTDAFSKGARVLIVDDLLATGGTAATACTLVQRVGGTVAGCLFLVELLGLQGRQKLDVPVRSIVTY